MVFGQVQKLQDQVFCLQEERNYFQAKYLEQVSEIQALKSDLTKAKKEIERLRQELMDTAVAPQPPTEYVHKQEEDDEDSTASCRTEDEDDAGSEHEEPEEETGYCNTTPRVIRQTATSTLYEEDVELRQSAEKLLQWASYRQSTSTIMSSGNSSREKQEETERPRRHDDEQIVEDNRHHPTTRRMHMLKNDEKKEEDEHNRSISDLSDSEGGAHEEEDDDDYADDDNDDDDDQERYTASARSPSSVLPLEQSSRQASHSGKSASLLERFEQAVTSL